MNNFFKDFFIYGFASIVGKVVAIFLIPVYTNVLTQEEYGAMALIVSCKGLIDLISNHLPKKSLGGDKNVFAALDTLYKNSMKEGKFLVIVIDEFGKILEHAAKNNPEK